MRQPVDFLNLPTASFEFDEMGEIQKQLQSIAESAAENQLEDVSDKCLSLAVSMGIKLDAAAIAAVRLEAEELAALEKEDDFQASDAASA